jgi:hypothetical protein
MRRGVEGAESLFSNSGGGGAWGFAAPLRGSGGLYRPHTQDFVLGYFRARLRGRGPWASCWGSWFPTLIAKSISPTQAELGWGTRQGLSVCRADGARVIL